MSDFSSSQIDAPTGDGSPLLAVSHHYGKDPAFILAGGGNTSAKRGDRLWIKASGHSLATIGPDGFVEMDRTQLEAMLAGEWPHDPKLRESLFIERLMAARISPHLGQRPSVETLLHHLLPHPLVVHTHPGVVNALTCCTHGEQIATELLGDDILWQPYVNPGLILAQTLQQALIGYRIAHSGRIPDAILLQNHGLIVGGETVASIAATTARIVDGISNRLATCALGPNTGTASESLLRIQAAALARCKPEWSVVADQSDAVSWLALQPPQRIADIAGPLTPDQIVYCRSIPIVIDVPSTDPSEAQQQWNSALQVYEERHGFAAWTGLIAGAGMLAFRDSAKMAEISRAVFADAASVCQNAVRLGGVRHLGFQDRKFIEEWEVEAHRRSIMSRSV